MSKDLLSLLDRRGEKRPMKFHHMQYCPPLSNVDGIHQCFLHKVNPPGSRWNRFRCSGNFWYHGLQQKGLEVTYWKMAMFKKQIFPHRHRITELCRDCRGLRTLLFFISLIAREIQTDK